MSGSLNQMPKYRANLPKEGHNIGMKYYFTSAPGMILPVYHHILNQGEKIAFNANVNTNVAIPLVKPAQLKVHQKIDVFFVPMQMMLTTFGQSFYGGNDFVTSLLAGVDFQDQMSSFPVLEFENLCSNLFNSVYNINRRSYISNDDDSVSPIFNTLGFDCVAKSAYRLLMHLGYNPQCVFADFDGYQDGSRTIKFNDLRSYQPNVFPAALLAYHAIYENYYRNDDREKRRIKTYQFDYMIEDSDVGNVPASIFQLHYHSRIKDYFTSLKVSPILSTLNLNDGFSENSSSHVLNSVLNFLDNSVLVTSNSSSQSVNNYNSEFSNKAITQLFSSQNSSRFSTGAIRSLFAVEKLNRILGRAKKDYDSQTLAHLGFKVPRDVKHEISYLGGYDGGIGVQQRYSQANTYNNTTGDGAELGEQFGTAEGGISGDHVINFEAPCHGLFMAVMYTVPETSYPQGVCIDKLNNITNRLDLYIPEFDKLGMQPLFAYEAVNRKVGNLNEADYYIVPENIILGWQYRYEQFKRKYNRHSVAFFRPRNISSEVNTWSPWIVGSEPFDFFDCAFPSETPNLASDALPSCYAFFVSPTYLDNLFVNSYNTHIGLVSDSNTTPTYTDVEKSSIYDYIEHPWLLFQTDMFMHAATFNVKLISTMSKYGEPELL